MTARVEEEIEQKAAKEAKVSALNKGWPKTALQRRDGGKSSSRSQKNLSSDHIGDQVLICPRFLCCLLFKFLLSLMFNFISAPFCHFMSVVQKEAVNALHD
jgi:hypothetical protein